jgi:hypothetical protein
MLRKFSRSLIFWRSELQDLMLLGLFETNNVSCADTNNPVSAIKFDPAKNGAT